MKKLSIHESCSIFNIKTIIIMEKLSDVEIRKISQIMFKISP